MYITFSTEVAHIEEPYTLHFDDGYEVQFSKEELDELIHGITEAVRGRELIEGELDE